MVDVIDIALMTVYFLVNSSFDYKLKTILFSINISYIIYM